MGSPSSGRSFTGVNLWTLRMGLAALVALVFAAAVVVIAFREQRRPPEFAGVLDARPQQDAGVDRHHQATKPELRDEGTFGLAESSPSASEPTPLPPPSATSIVSANDVNARILGLLPSMPSGGGSEANAKSLRDLEEAIQIQENQLKIKPAAAQTTYSSGATYLVFLQALQSLLPPGTLSGSLAEALTGRKAGNTQP